MLFTYACLGQLRQRRRAAPASSSPGSLFKTQSARATASGASQLGENGARILRPSRSTDLSDCQPFEGATNRHRRKSFHSSRRASLTSLRPCLRALAQEGRRPAVRLDDDLDDVPPEKVQTGQLRRAIGPSIRDEPRSLVAYRSAPESVAAPSNKALGQSGRPRIRRLMHLGQWRLLVLKSPARTTPARSSPATSATSASSEGIEQVETALDTRPCSIRSCGSRREPLAGARPRPTCSTCKTPRSGAATTRTGSRPSTH